MVNEESLRECLLDHGITATPDREGVVRKLIVVTAMILPAAEAGGGEKRVLEERG